MNLDEMKGVVKDAVSPLSEKLDAVDARIKAVEDLPIVKDTPAIIVREKEYKGKTIAKQGILFREKGISEETCDNFSKFLIDVATKTTLVEGTEANGGYLVKDEYADVLYELAKSSSFALQICKVMEMGTDVLKVPTEATKGAATWIEESGEKTDSDPTFGQVTLTAKKLMNLAVASGELIADSSFDIASLLAQQFAYTQGQEIDNQLFNGTGDPVSGVLTAKAGYSVILSAGASMSTVTATDLSLAISKLAEGRLGNARFLFGRLASHYVRSLKDSNNRPIYAEIGGTTPRTVYEYPVNMTENIANVDGASKALGVFGNFSNLLLGRRAGAMRIELDPYTLFAYDEVRFRMISRWAFGYGDANAFVRIMSATA